MAINWYVLCSPDKYCVVFPDQPLPPTSYPQHKILAGPFNSEDKAIAWRVQHCREFRPPGAPESDWLCP